MKIYPEIEKLQQYFTDFQILVQKLSDDNNLNSYWVRLTINNISWNIFIDDEYQDFKKDKQLVGLYLTLVSLEEYKISSDFLVWAKEFNVNASDSKWLDYYKSLENTLQEIEVIIGEINSQIPYFDYSMHTALGLALLEAKH